MVLNGTSTGSSRRSSYLGRPQGLFPPDLNRMGLEVDVWAADGHGHQYAQMGDTERGSQGDNTNKESRPDARPGSDVDHGNAKASAYQKGEARPWLHQLLAVGGSQPSTANSSDFALKKLKIHNFT